MLSKQSQYTLRALTHLSSVEGCVEIKTIAEIEKIPAPFLAKLFQDLARKKIISSKKGKNGGFYLTEKQKLRSVLDVIMFFEDKEKFNACGMGFNKCSEKNPCSLHHIYKPYRDNLKRYFQNIKIKQLKKRVL